MTYRRFVLACILGSATVGASPACRTEAERESFPSEDGGLAPPALAPEAAAPDASDASLPLTRPKRREVVCGPAGTPCVVALSGNGGRHFCALSVDGTVRCWGRDGASFTEILDDGGIVPGSDGALGRGKLVSALDGAAPARVVGLDHVTQISVGADFGTCARKDDGTVWCWGKNSVGQLGAPLTVTKLSAPRRVLGLPPVDEVLLGTSIGCAITTAERALFCWGDNATGAISEAPDAAGGILAPTRVTAFDGRISALAIAVWASDTIVALRKDGTMLSRGEAPAGEASFENGLPHEIQAVELVGPFSFVAAGVPQRWLSPSFYDPNGGPLSPTLPRPFYVPAANEIVELTHSGASARIGALGATGDLYLWGENGLGQVGLPSAAIATARYPVRVAALVGRVVTYATTKSATCASLVDGAVRCWGGNADGELGRGTLDSSEHPGPEIVP